jgi:uncharacterized protein
MFSFLRWTILPALLLGCVTVAMAALVGEVRDEAGFFSADAIQKANEVIKEIHKDFKKDLLIETYKTLPADKLEEFKKVEKDKAAREEFFQKWARQRGKQAEVNGVIILITKEPGHLEIEVGNETQKRDFTNADRRELRDLMVGKFKDAAKAKDETDKKKLHDEALLEGVRFVQKTMKSNIGTIKGSGPVHQPNPAPIHVPSQPAARGGGFNWGGLLCMGLIILAVVWVVFGLIRAFTGGFGGGGGWGGGYGGGGGGFMTGLLGGLFGAAAGSWLYDRFFRGDGFGGGGGWGSSAYGAGPSDEPRDTDYSGGGGDFGGDDGGGGGGGGDFGGDAGGGGGDFGGGGGDFGGGGGDFGGGGGDFGGGGGGDF